MYGIPRVITTDQGKEFHNLLNREMMDALGIQHRLTTTYHPQANGLDERYNQTLKKIIVKFIDGKPEEWAKFLPEIAYSYNTAVQEVYMKSNTLYSLPLMKLLHSNAMYCVLIPFSSAFL